MRELILSVVLALTSFTACGVPLTPQPESPILFEQSSLSAPKVLKANPTGALIGWQWSQGVGNPDAAGFLVSLGTAPGTYARTVDVPDKTLRSVSVTGLDLTKLNYAVVQSYTSFGIYSLPSSELVFGGTPATPLFLKATAVTP